MSKKVVIGGTLWMTALAACFHWGQLQSSKPTPLLDSPEKKSPFSTQRQTKADSRTFIEAILPDRNDIFVHDEIWLAASDWAWQNPEGAVTWLNELEFEDIRNPYLFAALSEWASQEPGSALAWLQNNLPEKLESEHYLKAALIRGMARHNANEALTFLLQQPPSLRRSTIDFILGAWAQEGASHLITNIKNLPEDLRQRAFEKACSHLTPEMLTEARLLGESLTEPEDRAALQTSIAERWAVREPKAALAWAEENSSPKVVGIAAKHWARREPLEASAWLQTQRDSPTYDLSARAIAWSLVGLDPHRAFSQVDAIKSEHLRLETFEQLGRFWISDQPTQARAFLEKENPLPPELQDALLSHFR